MENLDTFEIFISAGFIALGGLTKGLIGLGMPLVSVPLLSHLMPVPTAISVMLMSMLFTNIYQMVHGGQLVPAFRRFWPLLITLIVGISVGAHLLRSLETAVLSTVLGTVVILFALINFYQPRIIITPKQEQWVGPVVGLSAGILGGVAGLFGTPLGVYLVALRMPKDSFIGAIGTLFGVGTVPLLFSLVAFGIFGPREFLYSSMGLIPAFTGLLIGQRVRAWIPQESFRKVVLITLMVMGINLVRRAVMG